MTKVKWKEPIRALFWAGARLQRPAGRLQRDRFLTSDDMTPTPVTIEELVAEQVREILLCARQQMTNMLAMANEMARRELEEESKEIPKTRKIQVVHSLCEDDGLISKQMRDEILLGLGFEEMDPV